MTTRGLTLQRLAGRYAVARLDAALTIPPWARGSTFLCVTRTRQELSIVCDEAEVPAGTTAQRGLCGFRVEGPLDFSETGILASLAGPLAEAGVSIFALSTYDTDYLFLAQDQEHVAVEALLAAGHAFRPALET
jgi:hypothetical protein